MKVFSKEDEKLARKLEGHNLHFTARDKNGHLWAYSEKPEKKEEFWDDETGWI